MIKPSTYDVSKVILKCGVLYNPITAIFTFKQENTKGEIKPKSRLAHCRFSQKTVEFDLFAMKSKKANKSNYSIHFLGESMVYQSAFKIN